MGYESLGSQTGDSKKTPTLRQYIKQCGGKCPKSSNVKIIFKPGQYGGFSIVTDHDFRVAVLEDNPLHDYLSRNLHKLSSDETTLVVRISNPDKVEWELAIDTDWNSDWEEKTWGYKLSLQDKKPTRKKTGTTDGKPTSATPIE